MKITKKLAAATLVPAAAAGVTVSSLAVVHASTDQPGQSPARHTTAAQPAAEPATRAKPARPAARRAARKPASKDQAAALNHIRRSKAADRHLAHHRAARHLVAKPTPTATSMFAGMSSFERCVAWRESGENPAASSAGLFGILPSTWASLGYPGTAGSSSVALQKEAFNRLYAMYGTSPWAPYDGC